MEARGRRPRSALATVWILVACAVIGTGIGLVVRHVRSDDGGGPRPISVRPARPGQQSAAGLWLFGATTVRLDPVTLSDPRDVGFQGFGAVLAGEGTATARAALPDRVGGDRLDPQAVALGGGLLWIVGRSAVVALDPATLAVRRSFAVQPGAPVELHGAAVAGGLLWSYDVQSGALLGIGPDTGTVRQRIALTEGAQTQFRAPAAIIGGGDVLWVRV